MKKKEKKLSSHDLLHGIEPINNPGKFLADMKDNLTIYLNQGIPSDRCATQPNSKSR